MARVGLEQYVEALTKLHVDKLDFSGRSRKGYVYVEPEGAKAEKALNYWLKLTISFVASLPTKENQ